MCESACHVNWSMPGVIGGVFHGCSLLACWAWGGLILRTLWRAVWTSFSKLRAAQQEVLPLDVWDRTGSTGRYSMKMPRRSLGSSLQTLRQPLKNVKWSLQKTMLVWDSITLLINLVGLLLRKHFKATQTHFPCQFQKDILIMPIYQF